MRSPLHSRSLPTIPALYSMNDTDGSTRRSRCASCAGEPSVDSFVRLLGMIGEGIEEPRLPVGQCKSLIHLKVCIKLLF
ncbi:hypothetical protein M404DRAFT_513749 [Pisolithus tinctorius Marx 270]|uniref:Uncharacterized protein n=1 Tax=Pisolithus tinctorius Marx 270 TaxID=870435 RepID=A0A0C3J9E8_PISTI|nr:hypothetical protein M404DRAFT_513749 [Pisolithus tinctorius Marx 270]